MSSYQPSVLYSSSDLDGIIDQLKNNEKDNNILICIFINTADVGTSLGWQSLRSLVEDSEEFKQFVDKHEYYFIYEFSTESSKDDKFPNTLCRKLEKISGLNSEKIKAGARNNGIDYIAGRSSGVFVFNISNGQIKKKCFICNEYSSYGRLYSQCIMKQEDWNKLTETQRKTWKELGVFSDMYGKYYYYFASFGFYDGVKTHEEKCQVIENTVKWKMLCEVPQFRKWYYKSEDIIASFLYAHENNIPVIVGQGLPQCSKCKNVYDYDVITVFRDDEKVRQKCVVESIDFQGNGTFNNVAIWEYLQDKDYIFIFCLQDKDQYKNDARNWYESIFSGWYEIIAQERNGSGYLQTYWNKINGDSILKIHDCQNKSKDVIIKYMQDDFYGYEGFKKITYKVSFQDYDGTVLKEEQIEYGSSAIPPNNPSRFGYIFMEWSPSYSNVQSDLTIVAQYIINKNESDSEKKKEYESEDYTKLNTVAIPIENFGAQTTKHTYSDYNEHKLRISSNVTRINVYSNEDD